MFEKLHDNQNGGLVLLVLIIGGIMISGYFLITNFLESDEGQQIQETTTNVIEELPDLP